MTDSEKLDDIRGDMVAEFGFAGDRDARIEQKLDLILEKMAKVEEMTATVIEQVKPTIDELMNSSLGRMLGIKKGK